MKPKQFITTTQAAPLAKGTEAAEASVGLSLGTGRGKPILGFGGCFNELGWEALKSAEPSEAEKFMDSLYSPDGFGFTMARIPVGANDFSLEWYSLDDHKEDFAMEHFSLARDEEGILPYMRACMGGKDVTIMASPWSPPTWMKTHRTFNYGNMIWEEKYLRAYALYFVKFLKAYEEKGFHISQLHVQNEPISTQKFPSCVWSGEQLRDFIRDYLAPAFREHNIDTEIWLGTVNAPNAYDGSESWSRENYFQYAGLVLADPKAREAITGVGYQWGGEHSIAQTHQDYPGLRLMQTECECGDGQNTWEYAEYVFTLAKHYFANGAESFLYWNMALPKGGESTWGWRQNSLITVDPETGKISYMPEYYVMYHFSHFVQKGAKLCETTGNGSSTSVVFENPDGSIAAVMMNPYPEHRGIELSVGGKSYSLLQPGRSFSTAVLEK